MTSIAGIKLPNTSGTAWNVAKAGVGAAVVGGIVGLVAHKNPLVTAGIFGAVGLAAMGAFTLAGNGPINQSSEECWDGKDGQYLTHPFSSQC